MAYTTINKGSSYFNTVLYTGNDATNRSITGVGFQPDWTWIKSRSDAYYHELYEVVRGFSSTTNGRVLYSNTTGAEGTPNTFNSFNTDGFTVSKQSGETGTNGNGSTFVAWNWLANGAGVSNTAGTISSTVSANTTAGFSIVSYTGTGSVGSIGHGLGSTPKMIIKKKRSGADAWNVWQTSIGDGSKALFLNLTNAIDTNANYASNVPTSSLFYVGTDSMINGSGSTYIAYCFAEIKGYSKFGSYTGNGSADGTFIYTGFKPAFLIVKRYNDAGYDWLMYDNKRQVSFNVVDDFLKPNLADAETTGNAAQSLDFLSNGVKFRGTGASSNGSGASYIYMAFAENPFVTSGGIPVTAR